MIIGGEGPDPSVADVIRLDDLLADQGVPVFKRPLQAAKIWGEECGNAMLSLTKENEFRSAYRQLHPSVPFDSASFLTLSVSARGVSYIIRPPMGYGTIAISPRDHTDITDQEIARLWHDHREAFWELQWQSIDAIDLFMARVNFHTNDTSARNRIETAVCQLTASSRQLVACEIDSSLPQGMVMACELAGKAVLLRNGMDPHSVRQIGHDLPLLFSEISARIQSPIDATVSKVISSLPDYVAVRYDAPTMTIVGAQDLFRKALFVVADFLRRTNHDQMYWREVKGNKLPARDL